MLEARFGCASCVSWENVIYLLGGISANDNVIRSMVMLQCDVHGEAVTEWQSLHHILGTELAESSEVEVPLMKTARKYHQAVIIDNKICHWRL